MTVYQSAITKEEGAKISALLALVSAAKNAELKAKGYRWSYRGVDSAGNALYVLLRKDGSEVSAFPGSDYDRPRRAFYEIVLGRTRADDELARMQAQHVAWSREREQWIKGRTGKRGRH